MIASRSIQFIRFAQNLPSPTVAGAASKRAMNSSEKAMMHAWSRGGQWLGLGLGLGLWSAWRHRSAHPSRSRSRSRSRSPTPNQRLRTVSIASNCAACSALQVTSSQVRW